MPVNLPADAHPGQKAAFYFGACESFRKEHNTKGQPFRDARAALDVLIGDVPAYRPILELGSRVPIQVGVIKNNRFQHTKMYWNLTLDRISQGNKPEARDLYRATRDLWVQLREYNRVNYRPRREVVHKKLHSALKDCINDATYDEHNLDCFTTIDSVLTYIKPAGRVDETILAATRWLKVNKDIFDEESPEVEAVRFALNRAKTKAYKRLFWTPDITKIVSDIPFEDLPDPDEDFTTYTEVDGGTDNITVASQQIDFINLTRNEESYVYKNFGVDHFGDFEHLHSAEITSRGSSSVAVVYMLSDELNDAYYVRNNNGIIIRFFHASGPNENRINLLQTQGGSVLINDSFAPYVVTTQYWFTTDRSSTTVTCDIFDDIDRTSSVDTLTGTGTSDKYQYYSSLAAWNDGGANVCSGSVYNTDLQEAAVGSPWNYYAQQ